MPSLPQAVNKKYGEHANTCDFEVMYVPPESQRKRLPSVLVLDDCDIDCAGDEVEIAETCDGVRELDLARNKLSSWKEVIKILNKIECKLEFLNLSFNQLRLDENIVIQGQFQFSTLNRLVLNATLVTWPVVLKILEKAPCVEELHLSLNDISEVPDIEHPSDNHVRVVHFNSNPLEESKHFLSFGKLFPELKTLVLAECPLKSFGIEDILMTVFKSLQCLNVNCCKVDSWSEIDKLAGIKSLRDLRIDRCPLLEDFSGLERRQFLVSRLPQIVRLNGSVISASEREDCERAFIRWYNDHPEDERGDRYHQLVEKHGHLDPLVEIDLTPERQVNVTVKYEEKSCDMTVSVYQTVLELKAALHPMTGLSPSKMRLFYVDQVMSELLGPEELRTKERQLYHYNVKTGDSFIVDSKV